MYTDKKKTVPHKPGTVTMPVPPKLSPSAAKPRMKLCANATEKPRGNSTRNAIST